MNSPAEPSSSSPGSLIITFAGLHLRRLGGWIAVADLISLLGRAGQPAPAVRQAMVRLKSRGLLAAATRDGRAGYELTAAGRADLALGDTRIFRFGEASASDGWVLAVFSVPESERAQRHQLRSQLSWLGFGTVGAGVWIAPAPLADRARELLAGLDLDQYVTWFTGTPVDDAAAAAWWDLGSLQDLYEGFLARWETTPAEADEATAFVMYLRLVDEWRQFPRIDPGLPSHLLPPGWQGRRAFEVFAALRSSWERMAEQFVDAAVPAKSLSHSDLR